MLLFFLFKFLEVELALLLLENHCIFFITSYIFSQVKFPLKALMILIFILLQNCKIIHIFRIHTLYFSQSTS